MTDNFQSDFFEDRFYGKKGKKPHLLERYSKQRFLPYIKIPIEYTVISAIALLVLVIISYAVGVERGKSFSGVRPVEVQEITPFADEQTTRETADEDLPEEMPSPEIAEKPAEEKVKEEAEKEVTVSAEAGYVVQLASFRNERSARDEVNKLKRKGVEARMEKRGEWYQVYAAGYRTIQEAKRAKVELAADYKDCYIRQLK